jgi:hypothetical protein
VGEWNDKTGKERLCKELADVYDPQRNVLLTRKHYERRLKNFQRFNSAFEIFLAFGTSTTVAGWALWTTSIGDTAWAIIGGVIAILAVIKPILKLPAHIERFSVLATKYNSLLVDLQVIVFDIKSNAGLNVSGRQRFKAACEKLKNMGAREDPAVSEKIRRKLCIEVNNELPADNYWFPK